MSISLRCHLEWCAYRFVHPTPVAKALRDLRTSNQYTEQQCSSNKDQQLVKLIQIYEIWAQ